MTKSGLIRVRSYAPMTRRTFAQGARRARCADGVRRPYARRRRRRTSPSSAGRATTPASRVDDFLTKNDITLNTTYIGNNDEIVTKLTAGGVGSIDIVTPYMGYVPLLVALDVIQPIDESLVPNLADVMPVFRNDKNINVDGKLYARALHLGLGADDVRPGRHPDGADELGRPDEARIQGQGRHDGRPDRQHDAGGDHHQQAGGGDAADARAAEGGGRLPDRAEEGAGAHRRGELGRDGRRAVARRHRHHLLAAGRRSRSSAPTPARRSNTPIRRKAPSPGSTTTASPRTRRTARSTTRSPTRSSASPRRCISATS